MSDFTLGETQYIAFTTRAFASGIPTVLAGSPVVSAYEDAGLTQITAGITLGVDHDGVVGLNMLTVVATTGNGFEIGKSYNLVVTTGTVDSVSVVGEVVGQFTLGRSAAAVDLANATDGLTALKTVLDLAATAANLAIVDTVVDGIQTDLSNGTDGLGAIKTSVDAIPTTAMRGTDSAATAAALATVDGIVDAILVDTGTTLPASLATIDGNVDSILVDTGTTIPGQLDDMSGATFATATDSLEALRNRGDAAWTTGAGGSSPTVAEIRTEMDDNSTKLAAIVADTNELQADDIPGRFDGLEGATFDTSTDSNEAIRNRGDAAWAGGGSAPTVSQIRTEMDDNSTKLAAIVADTNELQADDVPGLIATLQADTDDIQTRLPASLAGGLMSSDAVAISGSTAAAVQLEASAETIVIAAAVTGTLSTTQMTSDLTEATDDHYNGRIIIWTSGALKDQATNITDYTGTNGLLTFTAITEAPSNADTFVIV